MNMKNGPACVRALATEIRGEDPGRTEGRMLEDFHQEVDVEGVHGWADFRHV